MRYSINQFMWGFQQHFRAGLERATRRVFDDIGFGLGARAFLVGFTDDPDRPFSVCFEPEEDPMAAVDLSDVVAQARTGYAEDPESRMLMSSARHRERFHRSLFDSHRAEALRRALADSAPGSEKTFFVGRSVLVDGRYEVHPVISVPTARWNSKPKLSRSRIDRYAVVPSFQDALMQEILAAATADLSRSTPPEDFSVYWSDRSELIRKAARSFVQSVSLYAGHEFPSELAVALDEVSAQPYEGRTGVGGILLAATDHPHIEVVMEFVDPIHLSESRSLRKALEMTDPRHQLLCDGEKVRGLARMLETYDPLGESAFNFTVAARGTWELSHHGEPLLRVANTRPTLPRPPLDPARFKSVAKRVFSEVGEVEADTLWNLSQEASRASHGTMLVVHRHADREAARLVPQAQQIRPQPLDPTTLGAVTTIDGAVLVDTQGACHAVGVILDGHATGSGDPSRGARFNSAVRYQAAQAGDTIVIIVSEDGMIDLLPDLRRQVSPSSIEAALDNLEQTIGEDPDFEVFFRHWEHLESLAFYLSEDQCGRANAARSALEEHRAKPDPRDTSGLGRITHVSWTPLEPDPAMNSSYFLAEGDDSGN
ncbi:hypothetical protein J2X46_003162 [Nocardioides sp. BE266]|uniref:diadenylate cyclase n=1 Tax=Nocardioides sp. BE266 TaxID=2817725 RepID=UPI002864230C|nr:diadenylate cyclase [Nocardioides sp. BE266]MDR7254169.1 hypothetical protein [Nocardioides sp. BE266]